MTLGDGRKILIFNTKGTVINVSPEVVSFLTFVETNEASNEYTHKLKHDVLKARFNKEWQVNYMKSLSLYYDALNEGLLKGEAEGRLQGRLQGDYGRVIKQIKNKIAKDKPLDVIADELEDTVENIKPIYDAILHLGVETDVWDIYEFLEMQNTTHE